MGSWTARRAAIRTQLRQVESRKEPASPRCGPTAILRAVGIESRAQRSPQCENPHLRVLIRTGRATTLADRSRRQRTHQTLENKKRRAAKPKAHAPALRASLRGPWGGLFAWHFARMPRTQPPT